MYDIEKPFSPDELLNRNRCCVDSIIDNCKENILETPYGATISKSPEIKKIFSLIETISKTNSTVLITGESGTGKELIARAIHFFSNRREYNFVALNCGAIPSELMENELFGHERGAYTGARTSRVGKFEYANKGTLFLDEISTLKLNLQIKFLRVIQERSIEKIGSNALIKLDLRIIAATNVDLEEEVRLKKFREDLYYRLNVLPIQLPPLRKRKEDIPFLIEHYINKYNKEFEKNILGIEKDALNIMINYMWPGNIRELKNLIEMLVVVKNDNTKIAIKDLPLNYLDSSVKYNYQNLSDAINLFEKNYILDILRKTNWNRNKTAEILQIHRNTLLFKVKEYNIKQDKDSDSGDKFF